MSGATVLKTSREIPATPQQVYAAFSDARRLARWWGPAGFTNTFHAFAFQPGGQWKFTMHAPNGADYANESEFVDLAPNARIVIRHVSPPQFVLTVDLKPSAGGTFVTWTQDFADPKVAAGIRSIAEPANEQNLDRLMAEIAAHG